jgi:hypothetical protein
MRACRALLGQRSAGAIVVAEPRRLSDPLDTTAHALSGEEAISYTNDSPDTLNALWLQVDQNRYCPHSRSHAADGAAVTKIAPAATGARW